MIEIPDPSVPSTKGSRVRPVGDHPSRMSASHPATPAVCTAINASRAPTSGTGRTWIVITSGPPNRSMAAARIVAGTACGPRRGRRARATIVRVAMRRAQTPAYTVGSTVSRFSTSVTPGALRAARSASRISA